jgi:hypothetical protein
MAAPVGRRQDDASAWVGLPHGRSPGVDCTEMSERTRWRRDAMVCAIIHPSISPHMGRIEAERIEHADGVVRLRWVYSPSKRSDSRCRLSKRRRTA